MTQEARGLVSEGGLSPRLPGGSVGRLPTHSPNPGPVGRGPCGPMLGEADGFGLRPPSPPPGRVLRLVRYLPAATARAGASPYAPCPDGARGPPPVPELPASRPAAPLRARDSPWPGGRLAVGHFPDLDDWPGLSAGPRGRPLQPPPPHGHLEDAACWRVCPAAQH